MSIDPDEARALAHAFARTLEHLREFRGVSYVGSAPMPAAVEADEQPLPLDAIVEQTPPAPSPAASPPAASPPAASPPAMSEPPAPPAPARSSVHNRPAQQSTYSSERLQSRAPANHSNPARREAPPERPTAPAPARASAEQWPAAKKLAYLRDRNVGDCKRCLLSRTRRNIVFGVGNPEADVMFIGEAPGADEDRVGEPFVGAAGRRLDQWIARLGMQRSDVYIANVLKCRPPGNRDPQPDEIERCSPFIHAQIRAIEPKVLIALGRFAGCLLLGREHKLWEMRGKVHRYREPKSGAEIPLVVTYHPAYVLRSEQRPPSGQAQPDRAGAIKSEDEKVLADLARAVSLTRGRV